MFKINGNLIAISNRLKVHKFIKFSFIIIIMSNFRNFLIKKKSKYFKNMKYFLMNDLKKQKNLLKRFSVKIFTLFDLIHFFL